MMSMHRSTTPDADALPAATTRLEQVAGQTGASRRVAASLVQVEAVLRSLDRTCLAAAAALIPPPEPHAGATLRAAAECCHQARALIESTYEDRQASALDIRAR